MAGQETKATAEYTVSFERSYLAVGGGGTSDGTTKRYEHETKTYKTFKGAVEAVIKAQIESVIGNAYGQKKSVESAMIRNASGEILINYGHETIRTSTENDGAFSNKWNKVVTVLEFAQGVEAEVEEIADKWAKRNADAVKTYFDIIERHSKRSPQAHFAVLKMFFEELQREKKAQAAAVVIEDVDANDEPDEREYFDVVPDDDDDDDDELDDGKIDELAATKEATALVAVAGTEKETRYEVEYFVYKKDGFIHRYGMLDYTSRLNDALELARRDAEIRGTAENFGGVTITRFVNGSGTVIVDLKREGTIETYDSEVDQILDAIENGAFEETVQTEQPTTARATETSTETALTIYIPRLETVEDTQATTMTAEIFAIDTVQPAGFTCYILAREKPRFLKAAISLISRVSGRAFGRAFWRFLPPYPPPSRYRAEIDNMIVARAR